MKIVAKDIEVVVWFNKEGISPIKFRYEGEDSSYITIKVDKIFSRAEEKYCGNLALVFECQSLIGDEMKLYQLKYFIEECKWILWKI
jgi:hypothetical protein